jgi:hypothetical protein
VPGTQEADMRTTGKKASRQKRSTGSSSISTRLKEASNAAKQLKDRFKTACVLDTNKLREKMTI